jgi:hypothetical protein
MNSKTRTLSLPLPKNTPSANTNITQVQSEGPVVIVGANGSGKTRLGTWIELESGETERVRRISAQKSLAMPPSATSIAVDRALTDLLYGYPDMQGLSPVQARRAYRWSGGSQNPSITPLSDFDKLLSYLFSDANEINAKYVEKVKRDSEHRIEPPETKLASTERIWEGVLPHRKLEIGGAR